MREPERILGGHISSFIVCIEHGLAGGLVNAFLITSSKTLHPPRNWGIQY